MEYLVSVTQDHIDESAQYVQDQIQQMQERGEFPLTTIKKADGSHCPVARAVHTTIPGFENAHVESTLIKQYRMQLSSPTIPLPQEVKDRIKGYDETGEMEPFEFKLEI